ncbi:hypothetical protein CfE428DRAFT_1958 [Chthoniobacter flavus Ellin428]|uniref:Uncharacterized protein n=2 Tax=Chthoniobacter flavus TaxID=191863 RepID=B4CZ70_9BACT|nr:hypothetical protein CfE428DRAFT_1958 [Chthoniobacter flavus Ellin428]TCO89655.1 hypothetical protein EV701_11391 [Chthoniobacter flavus]
MLLSWLVVTNHCALAQLEGRNMRHAHCHASKDDAGKQTPADGMRECCKAIKANLTGKQEIKFELSWIEVQSYALPQTLLAPVAIPASDFLQDHGPPRVVSFAENVLQRSLLSHAPPAFV